LAVFFLNITSLKKCKGYLKPKKFAVSYATALADLALVFFDAIDDKIVCAIALANNGGTAFPTCTYCSVFEPENTY
jgi:hypothetical protein